MKIFLGGTCNNSTWRDRIIPKLKAEYFDPIVNDWTEEAQKEEEHQKAVCDVHLYVITPLMKGVFSVAEVVQDSNNPKIVTVLCVLAEDDKKKFDETEMKSLDAVKAMVRDNGAFVSNSLASTVMYLNRLFEDSENE